MILDNRLFRTDTKRLFIWSKQGIILIKGFVKINLDELETYDVLEILDSLLDEELSRNQKDDIKEVREYFLEKINN